MGFFDKLKAAANLVTGGGAKVTIQWAPQTTFPGEPVNVQITVTSTGGPIKSTGLFVDVSANEELNVPANALGQNSPPVRHTKQTFNQAFPLAPPFTLNPNESRQFEGQFVIPPNAQPTYDGPFADHDWGMRARVDMAGNDPDSGFQKFIVGKKQ